jgi:hypothetical protein
MYKRLIKFFTRVPTVCDIVMTKANAKDRVTRLLSSPFPEDETFGISFAQLHSKPYRFCNHFRFILAIQSISSQQKPSRFGVPRFPHAYPLE